MANLISLEKVAKAYAHRRLLDGVSLGVSAGDRIGVVGRNGAGKSTLLGLLAGRVAPDTGRVAMAAGLRLGYLPQGDQLAGTVGEIVFGPMGGAAGGLAVPGSALERAGPDIPRAPWEADPRARAIMAELLPGIGVEAQAGRLSGGERRRVALAALLVAERDVLFLDEPTNHLDIEAIDWLGRHLRDRAEDRHCAVIVVSHDRWLLDTVCERTWEVDRGQVHSAEGGYSAYVLAQAERERGEEAAERRRRNLARKELAWLQRGARARTTKAKFRVEAANTLIASEPPPRDSVELTRLATARLGKTVIELEDVSVSVGASGRERVLLDQVTWRLGPGDRVGIVGVNGSGKTSLLTVLAGELVPGLAGPGLHADGTVIRGKTVRLAHLSQELAELDPDQRVREAVEEIQLRIRVGDRELSAGQLLERLGFTAERQWIRVGDLSGGERRRVQMLRLLMDEPNVLLLDEPTNDLDIETLTEFEDLLDGWPGTLVVVSHDRYFLERVTEHVVALLGDGKLAFLGGGVDEYLDRVRAARDAPASTRPATSAPRSSAADDRAARKELQRLERQLERLSAREAELAAQLAANATDYEKLTTLGADLKATQAEKADLEERWLTVAADLDP
ncbi:MAG: ABC-F family ATP-binding cassette domain-containing protein [Streptosporangiaceae bacterium]